MRSLCVFLMLAILSGQHLQATPYPPIEKFEEIGRTFSVSKNIPSRKAMEQFQARLKAAKPGDPELLKEIKNTFNDLPAPYLYIVAEYISQTDMGNAMEWYFLAHLRARLDAALCSDSTARQGINYIPALAPTVSQFIRGNLSEAAQIGMQALARPDLRSGRASPWWICVHGINAMTQAMQNNLSDEAREKMGLPTPEKKRQNTLDWLIPREAMAEMYDKVLSGSEKGLQKILEPQKN